MLIKAGPITKSSSSEAIARRLSDQSEWDWEEEIPFNLQQLLGEWQTGQLDLKRAFGFGQDAETRSLQTALADDDTATLQDGEVDSAWCEAKADDILGKNESYKQYKFQCDSYQKRFRATTVFSMGLGSAGLGVIYFVLGAVQGIRFPHSPSVFCYRDMSGHFSQHPANLVDMFIDFFVEIIVLSKAELQEPPTVSLGD